MILFSPNIYYLQKDGMEAANKFIKDLDLDGDQKLNFEEFLMACGGFMMIVHEELGGMLSSQQLTNK